MPVYFKGDKITPIIKDNITIKKLVERTSLQLTAEDLSGITVIGGSAFRSYLGLTSIVIPNTVTTIGSSAFQESRGLTYLNIPNSVTNIGSFAFYGNYNLKTLIIGTGIQQFDNWAAGNCTGLLKVAIRAITPPVLQYGTVFNNTNNCPIYVPTPNDYKVETNWVALEARIFPLVNTVSDLSNIDTTIYTKACVIGADESYKEYTYDGSQWNEVQQL